MVVNRLTIP